jgi:hypothetical protein
MATLREWRRPTREAWWALVGFCIGYFVIAYALIDAMPHTPSSADIVFTSAALVVICLVAAILAYRVFAHSRLVATEDGLVVSNPFRSDQRVSWGEISTMHAERLLIVRLTSGRRIVVWTIQKNGWSRARHRRAHADEVIAELSDLASSRLAQPREFAAP